MPRPPLSEAGYNAAMFALPFVCLFVFLFNSYKMGRISKKGIIRILLLAFVFLLVCVMALTGCARQNEDFTVPTGYPSEEMQQPQIMYTGQIYYYFATGFDEPLPDGYSCAGMVEVVDNAHTPETEYHGARVEWGQEIYALPGVHDTIYVKYENGYARFSLKKENDPQTEIANRPVLTLKLLEAACADGFIDPSKVTVLNGEWAYTVVPDKYVALATVRYTNKDSEYETADFIMVGVFGGDVEMYHCLNQHSPYTRENALETYGAIDDQRFPLA